MDHSSDPASLASAAAAAIKDDTARSACGAATPDQQDAHETTQTFRGTIVQRRSMGRRLAFCRLRLTERAEATSLAEADTTSCSPEHIVSIVFRDECQGDAFPTKKTALPYGAQVEVIVQIDAPAKRPDAKGKDEPPRFLVVAWQRISSPHDEAMVESMVPTGGGIVSDSDYKRARRLRFVEATRGVIPKDGPSKTHRKGPSGKPLGARDTTADGDNRKSYDKTSMNHGQAKSSKSQRATVFADWIVEQWSEQLQCTPTTAATTSETTERRILDVAGGKGDLSQQLLRRLPPPCACTVVDPVVRRVRAKASERLEHCHGYFVYRRRTQPDILSSTTDDNAVASSMSKLALVDVQELLASHSLMVGLHPDQCTEDIVDAALDFNRSMAVIPCCVFPDLFATRRLKDGTPARTYEHFLDYLLQKDPRLKRTTLPFEGKNVCIYLNVQCRRR